MTEIRQQVSNFSLFLNLDRGVVKSSSGESLPAGASATSSHPYKIPQPPSAIVKYDSDFPLRKTGKQQKKSLLKALFFECACEKFNENNQGETFFLSVACEITFFVLKMPFNSFYFFFSIKDLKSFSFSRENLSDDLL